jgi:hypothetical protein
MAHTAPAAPFVLHHTLIGNGAMKIFGIDSQWRKEPFFNRHISFLNRKSHDEYECSQNHLIERYIVGKRITALERKSIGIVLGNQRRERMPDIQGG